MRGLGNSYDIIAFTFAADVYCPDCTRKAFPKAGSFIVDGRCPECNSREMSADGECFDCKKTIPAEDRTDFEGNIPCPVFREDEWQWEETGLFCGDCHEEIISAPKPTCSYCESEVDSEEDLTDYDDDGEKHSLCSDCLEEFQTIAEERQLTIAGNRWLAVELLACHGGQFSPSYQVGTAWQCGQSVPVALVREAIGELRKTSDCWEVADMLEGYLAEESTFQVIPDNEYQWCHLAIHHIG